MRRETSKRIPIDPASLLDAPPADLNPADLLDEPPVFLASEVTLDKPPAFLDPADLLDEPPAFLDPADLLDEPPPQKAPVGASATRQPDLSMVAQQDGTPRTRSRSEVQAAPPSEAFLQLEARRRELREMGRYNLAKDAWEAGKVLLAEAGHSVGEKLPSIVAGGVAMTGDMLESRAKQQRLDQEKGFAQELNSLRLLGVAGAEERRANELQKEFGAVAERGEAGEWTVKMPLSDKEWKAQVLTSSASSFLNRLDEARGARQLARTEANPRYFPRGKLMEGNFTLSRVFEGAGDSIPGMMLAVANPVAGAAYMASAESAPAYVEMREKGMKPGDAAAMTALHAAGTYLLDKLPLDVVNSTALKSKLAKIFGRQAAAGLAVTSAAAAEGGTEDVQEVWQWATENGFRGSREEFEKDIDLWQTFLSSALVGGGMQAGAQETEAYQRGKERRERYTDIVVNRYWQGKAREVANLAFQNATRINISARVEQARERGEKAAAAAVEALNTSPDPARQLSSTPAVDSGVQPEVGTTAPVADAGQVALTAETTPAAVEAPSPAPEVIAAPDDSSPPPTGYEARYFDAMGRPFIEEEASLVDLDPMYIPNFKRNVNNKGINKPIKTYDRKDVGRIVIWEGTKPDGSKVRAVATGRHRVDAALRAGETSIPAIVLRESDGYTLQDASIQDAVSNIKDNQGETDDYAHFFRQTRPSREEAARLDLLRNVRGQIGFDIGTAASESLYSLYRNGQISEAKAAVIARAAPNDEALQQQGILAAKGKSPEELDAFLRAMKLRTAQRAQEGMQGDLFGFDDSAMREMEDLSKRAVAKQREIDNELRALKGARRLTGEKFQKYLAEYGLGLSDPAALESRIASLEQEQILWQNWDTNPDLVRQLSTPTLTLETQTPADVEAERARAEERATAEAQRKKLEEGMAAPMTGNNADVGQGVLFNDGSADLFSGPPAETISPTPPVEGSTPVAGEGNLQGQQPTQPAAEDVVFPAKDVVVDPVGENATQQPTQPAATAEVDEMLEEQLKQGIELFLKRNGVSIQALQRALRIGYTRAYNLVNLMEERGMIGPVKQGGGRDILVGPAEDAKVDLKIGDRFVDSEGATWEVWNARTSLIHALPVINGKVKASAPDKTYFALDARARAAYPEARTNFAKIISRFAITPVTNPPSALDTASVTPVESTTQRSQPAADAGLVSGDTGFITDEQAKAWKGNWRSLPEDMVWRMTRKSYVNLVRRGSVLREKTTNPPISRQVHKLAVESALREGKPVPAEVLADYPDLAPTPAQEAAAPAAPPVEASAYRPAVSQEQDAAYKAAVEAGDMETAEQMVEEAARAAGYDLIHRGRNPETSTDIVQYAAIDDAERTRSYGKKAWYARSSDLGDASDLPHEFYKWLDENYPGYEVNPPNIVDDAGAWDDRQFVSDLWQAGWESGNWLNKNGYKTSDGAVLFPGANVSKSADPVIRDDQGNVIPLSERFNEDKADAELVDMNEDPAEPEVAAGNVNPAVTHRVEQSGEKFEGQFEKFNRADSLVGERGRLRTGEGFVAKLYRGEGGGVVEGGRGEESVLGSGVYAAFSEKDAADYGEVSEVVVELKNPLVLESDADLKAIPLLQKLAADSFAGENTKGQVAAVRRELERLGYDGVVVQFPIGDVAFDGQSGVKVLRALFDVPQVVKFEKAGKRQTAGNVNPGMAARASSGRNFPVMPEARVRPVQAAPIVKFIENAFNVKISGKLTYPKLTSLGHFEQVSGTVRLNDVRDLDTALHELGHRIDREMDTISGSKGVPPAVKKELAAMGRNLYGNQKPAIGYKSEGMAEYVAFRAMGGDMRQIAPATHEWFDKVYLNSKKRAKAFRRLEMKMNDFRYAGAAGRVRGFWRDLQMDWSPESTAARVKAWAGSVFDAAVNINDGVKRDMEKAGVDVKNLPSKDDPFALLTAFSMAAPGKARSALFERTVDVYGRENGESLLDALAPIGEDAGRERQAEFLDYLIARRALQIISAGKEAGISRQDASEVVRRYESPEFQEAARRVKDWAFRLLQLRVDAGLMSQEEWQRLYDVNEVYVPFTRQFYKGELREGGGGTGGNRSLLRLVGSGREVQHPYDSFAQLARNTYELVQRETVLNAAVGLYESRMEGNIRKEGPSGNIGVLVSKIPPPKLVEMLNLNQVLTEAQKQNLAEGKVDAAEVLGDALDALSDLDVEPGVKLFEIGKKWLGKENVITRKGPDGTVEFYEVSPALYRALNQKVQESNALFRLARDMGGLIRLGATGINPSFVLRNLVRDTGTASVTSAYGLNPISVLKGIAEEMRDSPMSRLYAGAGVELSGWWGQDKASLKGVRQKLTMYKAGKRVQYEAMHPVDLMRAVIGFTESGPRFAEFEAAYKSELARTGDPVSALVTATIAGKDVTVNFTRAGEVGRNMNGLWLFLNAGIQSMDKVRRSAVKDPVGLVGRGMLYVTLAAAISYLGNRDKEWWKKLKPHDKWGKLWWEFGDVRVGIPLPFELGSVFGSLPIAAMEEQRTPGAFREALDLAVQNSTPDAVPTLLRGVLENVSNKDWKGDPIVNEYAAENLLPEYQYSEDTSELSKIAGRLLEFSPDRIDHLLNFYSGGLYLRVQKMLERETRPRARELADLPVVGTFFLREGNTRTLGDFKQELDQLNRRHNSGVISLEQRGRLYVLQSTERWLRDRWEEIGNLRAADIDEEIRRSAEKEIRQNIEAVLTRVMSGTPEQYKAMGEAVLAERLNRRNVRDVDLDLFRRVMQERGVVP